MPETINVACATCRPFLEKFENDILEFQKHLKTNLDVDNEVFYQRVKSYLITACILGHTKMKKSDNFWRFQNLHCSLLQISSFVILHSLEYKVFQFEILHVCRIHHYLHLGFFRIFWNSKMLFSNYSKKGLHVAGATKRRTPKFAPF